MKKIIKYLAIVILILGFAQVCYLIFNDKYTFKAKITSVNNEFISFKGNTSNEERFKGELKYYINNDTKYYLFDDEIDYKYLLNNYIRFNSLVTIKDDKIHSIKLTPEKNKMDIFAFIKNDTSKEDIKKIKDTLSIVVHVLSVKYVSSEEAKEKMSDASDILKETLNSLEDNPLLGYFIITVDGNINQIVRYLNNLNAIDTVKY